MTKSTRTSDSVIAEPPPAFLLRLTTFFNRPHWLLLPLLVVTMLLRYPTVDYGLPYAYFWDEPEIMNPAIGVLRYGEYSPSRFAYGPLNGYLHAAWGALTFVRGVEKGEFPDGIWELNNVRETAWYWYITSPYFWHQARILSVLLGCVTVVLVFAAGLRLGGAMVALWAGSVVALSRTAINQTTMVTSDCHAITAAALVLWASAHIFTGRTAWAYTVAAIGSGLAVAFKYTMVPVILFPLLAHLLGTSSKNGSLIDGRLFRLLALFIVSGALLLFPVFLQPTRFLHDLSTEALFYGIAGKSGFSEYAVALVRAFSASLDAASANKLVVISGLPLMVVTLIGIAAMTRRNPRLLIVLLIPALANVHLIGSHTEKFYERNVLLTQVGLAAVGGFGCRSLTPIIQRVLPFPTVRARMPAVQVVIYIMAFLPLLVWGVRNVVERITFVDSRVQLSQKLIDELPQGSKILVAAETRWYSSREELKKFQFTERPILRIMTNPPPTSAVEYLIVPKEINAYRPSPLKQEICDVMNSWLRRLKNEAGFEFGEEAVYFGKPSKYPAVRLVRNTEDLQETRLLTTDMIYATQFSADTRNNDNKLSDNGLAVRPGVMLSAPVRISREMKQVTIEARGMSPQRQDIVPSLRLEMHTADAQSTISLVTADFTLGRSQAGLIEYSAGMQLSPGNYIARIRGSDPENRRIEFTIVRFN